MLEISEQSLFVSNSSHAKSVRSAVPQEESKSIAVAKPNNHQQIEEEIRELGVGTSPNPSPVIKKEPEHTILSFVDELIEQEKKKIQLRKM